MASAWHCVQLHDWVVHFSINFFFLPMVSWLFWWLNHSRCGDSEVTIKIKETLLFSHSQFHMILSQKVKIQYRLPYNYHQIIHLKQQTKLRLVSSVLLPKFSIVSNLCTGWIVLAQRARWHSWCSVDGHPCLWLSAGTLTHLAPLWLPGLCSSAGWRAQSSLTHRHSLTHSPIHSPLDVRPNYALSLVPWYHLRSKTRLSLPDGMGWACAFTVWAESGWSPWPLVGLAGWMNYIIILECRKCRHEHFHDGRCVCWPNKSEQDLNYKRFDNMSCDSDLLAAFDGLASASCGTWNTWVPGLATFK